MIRSATLVPLLLAALRLPDVLTAPLGRGPRADDGVPLGPRLRWFLRLMSLDPTDLGRAPPAEERDAFARLSASWAAGPLHRDVLTEDRRVPVPVRLYLPPAAEEEAAARPLLLWIHGGGWVIGDLETHDRLCRRLSREVGAVVVAVDYRRAPEHPFPAPLEDVAAVWRWIRASTGELGVDPERLAVGGDSAGGNMTAVLCQQLPPAERPCLQVLCYPGTDFHSTAPSRARYAEGFFLTEPLIRWFLDHYTGPDADRTDPRVSPLRAGETALREQPPALVITAGLDPLLDEGRAYADRLEAAGNEVERQHVPAMIHGFVTLYGLLPGAEAAMADLIGRLRARLGADSRP